MEEHGLLFDRNWMIVNENGVCLSQKQEPRLCLIRPLIDMMKNTMIIQAKGNQFIPVFKAYKLVFLCNCSLLTAHGWQNV